MLTPFEAAKAACGETAPLWLLNSVADAIAVARAAGYLTGIDRYYVNQRDLDDLGVDAGQLREARGC